MSNFGNVLRKLRNENRLTQTQLAQKLGVAFSTISMYERGEREPDFETTEAIADFFNVSFDYLLGNEPKIDFSPINTEVLKFRTNTNLPFKGFDESFIATNREKKMIMEYRTKPEKQNAVNTILNIENPTALSDEALMFALYGGDNKDITPEMLNDVRDFAQYIREKKNKNK